MFADDVKLRFFSVTIYREETASMLKSSFVGLEVFTLAARENSSRGREKRPLFKPD